MDDEELKRYVALNHAKGLTVGAIVRLLGTGEPRVRKAHIDLGLTPNPAKHQTRRQYPFTGKQASR